MSQTGASYSKLPMTRSEWNRENLLYALIYFQWIGGLNGLVIYRIFCLKECCEAHGACVSDFTFTVSMVIASVFITGEIHMDGFVYGCKDQYRNYVIVKSTLRIENLKMVCRKRKGKCYESDNLL